MIIQIVVAVAENNVIGKDNAIPWFLPSELQYFKKQTSNGVIVMGRKTFESMNQRRLPNRYSMILSRNSNYAETFCADESAACFNDLTVEQIISHAIDVCQKNNWQKISIIGGSEIYKLFMESVDRIVLTRVNVDVEGDTFFINIDSEQWNCQIDDPVTYDGIKCQHELYTNV